MVTARHPDARTYPDLSGETYIPARAPTLLPTDACKHARFPHHHHTHTPHAPPTPPHTPHAHWSWGSISRSHQTPRSMAGQMRRAPQRPLPPAPYHAAAPGPACWVRTALRPGGFLKGKVASASEAECRPESARPAALLPAPPELVVFWFRGGGGQDFGESLETEKAWET